MFIKLLKILALLITIASSIINMLYLSGNNRTLEGVLFAIGSLAVSCLWGCVQVQRFQQKQSAKSEVLRITSLPFPLGDRDIERLIKAAELSGLSTEDLSNILDISYATTSSSAEVIEKSNCKYNAKSPYLRCAVNPCGSCKSCKYFEEV